MGRVGCAGEGGEVSGGNEKVVGGEGAGGRVMLVGLEGFGLRESTWAEEEFVVEDVGEGRGWGFRGLGEMNEDNRCGCRIKRGKRGQ